MIQILSMMPTLPGSRGDDVIGLIIGVFCLSSIVAKIASEGELSPPMWGLINAGLCALALLLFPDWPVANLMGATVTTLLMIFTYRVCANR